MEILKDIFALIGVLFTAWFLKHWFKNAKEEFRKEKENKNA